MKISSVLRYAAPAPIWRVLPVPGRARLVLEVRSSESRSVSICLFDCPTQAVRWQVVPPGDSWWYFLKLVNTQQVVLGQFTSMANPVAVQDFALALTDGRVVDVNEGADGALPGVTVPTRFFPDTDEYRTVERFLLSKGKESLVGPFEYAEVAGGVVVAFHRKQTSDLQQEIVFLNAAGEVVEEEVLYRKVAGVGADIFFVWDEKLVTVREKNELLVYALA